MTRWLRHSQPYTPLAPNYKVILGIHKVVTWLEMVSLQPVKPTIISFCATKPSAQKLCDKCRFVFFHLLGKQT